MPSRGKPCRYADVWSARDGRVKGQAWSGEDSGSRVRIWNCQCWAPFSRLTLLVDSCSAWNIGADLPENYRILCLGYEEGPAPSRGLPVYRAPACHFRLSGAWVSTEAASCLISAAVCFFSPESTLEARVAIGWDVFSFLAMCSSLARENEMVNVAQAALLFSTRV